VKPTVGRQRQTAIGRALAAVGRGPERPFAARADAGISGETGRDGGFVLLESVVAIGVVAVLMAALTTLFITTSQTTNHLRVRQEAIQLADTGVEQIRAYNPASLASGRDAASVATQYNAGVATGSPAALSTVLNTMVPTSDPNTPSVSAPTNPPACINRSSTTVYLPTVPVCQSVGIRPFYVSNYIGNCYTPMSATAACVSTKPAGGAAFVTYQRVVVAITWSDSRCSASSCLYVTSTLVDNNPDPTFNTVHAGTNAPVISVNDRASNVGDIAPFPSPTLLNNTGVAPFTWSATGLPPGLAMAADGSITGTVGDFATLYPNAPSHSYTVLVTVVDGAIQQNSAPFVWTVYRPIVTTPSDQTTVINKPVNLQVVSTCVVTPCTWTMTNAPVGLSISSTGLITGSPTVAGTVTMTVTVRDGNGVSDTSDPFRWAVLTPATVCVPEIALANGSFEAPVVSHGAPNWMVGGSSPLLWDTTEPDNVIELWKDDGAGPQTGTTVQAANGGKPISAEDGSQWAELNANQTGALFQDLPTVSGQILQWSVWHRGRYSSAANATKKDVMQVQIGSTTSQSAQVPTGQTSANISDGPDAWVLYRGIYTVPAGQTLTRFQFAAISTASGDNSIGNFIDNLSLNNYVACLNTAPTDQTSTVNTPIPSLQLSASRGSGQFVWGGGNTLPAGLTLSSNGLITGTPTQPGTSAVLLTLTDTQTTFEQSVSFNWTVVPKPTVTAPSTQRTSTGGTVNLALATTCLNLPCSYAMDSGPAGLTVSNTGVVTGTVTSAAQTFNSVTVTVRDNEGVTATTAPFSWIVNPTPALSGPGDQKTLRGASVSLSAAPFANGGTGSYTYSASNLPSWLSMNSNTGVITGTAPAGADSVTTAITVTVTDSTGASGTSPAFSWTVYAAPSVTSPGAQASSVGTTVSLALATSCPNSPCTYSLNQNAPAGLSITSGATITGTITGNPITYTGVVVSVTDAGGATTSSAAFNWVVNPAPKLVSPGGQRTVRSGLASLSMAMYASGGTGSYSYSASGLPSWLSINTATGVISGTAPSTTSNTTGITVTLKDATNATSTTASFAWAVSNTLATTFSSQTSYKGSAVSLDLDNFTSGGTAPYTYTATGLPSWLTLNRTTGVLSGTAPTVAVNTTTKTTGIVITATDSASPRATASATINWYVTDLAWIGAGANGSVLSTPHGTSLSGYNAASYVSGGAAGARTYSAINLPTGVSVSASGAIIGTPSTVGTWQSTLSVTDSVGATVNSVITWKVT
jgi:type II secretory pathway pseudopilin PulG